MSIRVGRPAPHVSVEAYVRDEREPIRLSPRDFAGRWVVLFFYPRDFGAACPDQLRAFADLHEAFEAQEAVVLGASTDSYWSHRAWFESHSVLRDVRFPVLADTAHELAAAYGVLLHDGSALRATVAIDPDGEVRHLSVTETDTDTALGRSPDDTLRVLQSLRTGAPSPIGWRQGRPSLADAA